MLGDDGMPDYSPDGTRIVFTSNRDQQGEIYVMNADGSGQKRLTRRPGDDWSPSFSPDGTRIAFTQLPGTIWVMNADGTRLRKLTAGVDADWRPEPSNRLSLGPSSGGRSVRDEDVDRGDRAGTQEATLDLGPLAARLPPC